MAVMYEIKVTSNPNCCGIGAGGVQFAYGKATLPAGRLVDWFREHDGYEVTEVAENGSTVKTIDKMTVAELKAYAADNGIDIGDADKKADIIGIIKDAEA